MDSSASPQLFRRQLFLLRIFYWLCAPLALFARRRISWVVGTEEIAHMVAQIGGAIPGAVTVVHQRHPYYEPDYNLVIHDKTSRFEVLRRIYGGPIVLAWLLHRTEGFIYVGAAGFLFSQQDSREAEFAFIKRRGKRIVCYFTGSDIRSQRLMNELQQRTGRTNVASFLGQVDDTFTTPEHETVLRERARVADEYADVIFNARQDQLSYLTHETEPFLYFYPDEAFHKNSAKFESLDLPVIVHAPSNPLVKGTPLVRAAIDRLCADGYVFDYRELSGVSNEAVLAALGDAHIVLNQFYAFVPGVFGIEALAQNCAVLMSADRAIETDLDEGANEAWVVTGYDEIYENLKNLLDNPHLIRPQAERGFAWALKNASGTESAKRLRAALDQ